MPDTPRAVRQAYAKLNLLLSVAAPVPSDQPKAGWHKIESWMHCIDLCDDVVVEKGEKTSLSVQWADDAPRKSDIDWPTEKDLCVRALAALSSATGTPLHARILLTKRIPTQAGLGGGSSDAACTLLAVNEVFHLGLSHDALLEIGMTLGSDVGFFLDSGRTPRPALVSGFGETLERTDALNDRVVLVLSSLACSTPEVYASFDRGLDRTTRARSRLVRGRAERMLMRGELDGSVLMNDLAKPAYRVEPRLGKLATAISNATRQNVHVTGSGAALFLAPGKKALARTLEKATRVADTFSDLGCVVREVALR